MSNQLEEDNETFSVDRHGSGELCPVSSLKEK